MSCVVAGNSQFSSQVNFAGSLQFYELMNFCAKKTSCKLS